MSGKRNACGVCTARKAARGGVASTRPCASTCLTVSLSGVPGRRRAVPLGRFDRARDKLGRGKGARRVMDEDDVGRGRGQRLEPGEHALLARRAADRWRPERGLRRGRQIAPAPAS